MLDTCEVILMMMRVSQWEEGEQPPCGKQRGDPLCAQHDAVSVCVSAVRQAHRQAVVQRELLFCHVITAVKRNTVLYDLFPTTEEAVSSSRTV